MSKYTKGDWVRVTNPISKRYDMVGQIIIEASSSSWRAYVVKIGDERYTIKEEFLTLAEPDTHTVPGQMDAGSAPKDPDLYCGPVTATVYPTDRMPWAQRRKKILDAAEAPCITTEQWAKAVTPPNRRAQVLRTAEGLINGDRAKDYGDPRTNFGRIAGLLNAQFKHKLASDFTAGDVALILTHLKLSRLANTPDHADSFVDAIGYLALGAELTEGL